ncbi:hypothetical protein AB4144_43700, partial [Rhizobiaceae sp. 2RAB30]
EPQACGADYRPKALAADEIELASKPAQRSRQLPGSRLAVAQSRQSAGSRVYDNDPTSRHSPL